MATRPSCVQAMSKRSLEEAPHRERRSEIHGIWWETEPRRDGLLTGIGLPRKARGGARGFNVGIYSSPMECMGKKGSMPVSICFGRNGLHPRSDGLQPNSLLASTVAIACWEEWGSHIFLVEMPFLRTFLFVASPRAREFFRSGLHDEQVTAPQVVIVVPCRMQIHLAVVIGDFTLTWSISPFQEHDL